MPAFKRLTYTDRLRIETLSNAGHGPREIAGILGRHPATIYRELKRGLYQRLRTDLTTAPAYSAEIADRRYRFLCSACGAPLKIGACHELARYIEGKICDDHYSPDAVIGELRAGPNPYPVTICTSTLYSYISKGIFGRLSNRDLLRKGKQKREYHHVKRAKRPPAGDSIEARPEAINARAEAGHWEGDLVIGSKAAGPALLTMTERVTRAERLRLIPGKTAAAVVAAIDRIERELGPAFRAVFRSITFDNGPEFSDAAGLQRSIDGGAARTHVYYAHPYSAWERGANENHNAMVRRFLPKGKSFDSLTEQDVAEVERWMNSYPRRVLGYSTPDKEFYKYFRKTT